MMTPQLSSYRYVIFAVGGFVQFVIGTMIYLIPPMVGVLRDELDLTYSELGLLIGSVSLAVVVFAFPAGVLADRVGGKRAVGLGMTLAAIASLMRGVFPFPLMLFISTFLVAAGVIIATVGIPKVIGQWFSAKQLATVFAIWSGFWSAGPLVAFGTTMSLVYPFMGSWTGVFLFHGVVAVVGAGAWWVFAKEPQANTAQPREERVSLRRGIPIIARNKIIWLLCGMFFCVVGVELGIAGWLPHILELRGLSPTVAGYTSALIWVGALLSAPVGAISDRMGVRIPFLVVSSITYGVAILVVGATLGLPLWIAATLFGFTMNVGWIIILIMPLELNAVGAKLAGVAIGLIYTFGFVGGFIVPFVGGYLGEVSGDFTLTIALFAILAGVTAILALVTKETGWKKQNNRACDSSIAQRR